ncbi:MAG TPA: peptidylprolyl isomerase [Lacunisphaera sp.]|nr:peptidylprolyl isomerase [Lacunisphaera sp.]
MNQAEARKVPETNVGSALAPTFRPSHRTKKSSLNLLCAFVLLLCGRLAADEKMADGVYAEFTTPRGKFVVELNCHEAPMTVASFVGLAEGSLAPRDGKPYYTGLKFYRVVPGFVIQSGDPEHEKNRDKDDPGTPYTFPDEFVPGLRHATAGVLSMANAGPDTNSCEFFLTLGDCTRLNYLHSVFGHVFTGLDVLAKIQPDDEFTIKILRIGTAGRAFQADAATFKALVARAKIYAGPKEPGPDAYFDDPSGLIPVDPPRAKNFNFKLANYERTTGLKIKARLFAKSPTEAEDKVPGAFMRALAARIGADQRGVAVAYFADENDWRMWISDDLVPAFLGRPARTEDLADGGPLHQAKAALMEKAQADGDAAFVAQQKTAPAEQPPPPGQRIKLQTDAILDALLIRLEKNR